ncbi:uncharacterized protein LOC127639576 isoform X2 [Xyrauchen texanus]|uniref:uncharacterized protein LOC127639576 isoform X2 n=1 Tax=Xyrauchen texanus TaxID=154827 RepID=UPI0022424D01|nr:uncharacterized protein LOC127639576 isoform X2 [Xyrauchen texanus]
MLLFSRKKCIRRHVDFSYQRLFGCLLRNMFSSSAFLYLYILIANDVLSDNSDELKTVLEGDSVTLHTNITEVQRDDHILWRFGPRNTRIAEIFKRDQINFIWVSNDEIFRDKLQLNNQTGSLTIKNITITHTGLYQVEMIRSGGTSVKRFIIIVYSPLPVPAITNNCSSSSSSSSSKRSSSSKCVLVCSVVTVTHVTLSWYKGNSLLSSISVSDLNSLSLPLEVEYQENNIYSCVVNNPIRNQTKHLNINEVCQTCSDQTPRYYHIPLIVAVVLLVIIAVIGIMMFWHWRGGKLPCQKGN